MTKRAILYVTTAPAEGREDEWNTWYDQVHIPEILEHVDGVTAATRFRQATGSPAGGEQTDYCTVYEIEADDPASVVAALSAAVQGGKIHLSDASAGISKMYLWEENTARVTGS